MCSSLSSWLLEEILFCILRSYWQFFVMMAILRNYKKTEHLLWNLSQRKFIKTYNFCSRDSMILINWLGKWLATFAESCGLLFLLAVCKVLWRHSLFKLQMPSAVSISPSLNWGTHKRWINWICQKIFYFLLWVKLQITFDFLFPWCKLFTSLIRHSPPGKCPFLWITTFQVCNTDLLLKIWSLMPNTV